MFCHHHRGKEQKLDQWFDSRFFLRINIYFALWTQRVNTGVASCFQSQLACNYGPLRVATTLRGSALPGRDGIGRGGGTPREQWPSVVHQTRHPDPRNLLFQDTALPCLQNLVVLLFCPFFLALASWKLLAGSCLNCTGLQIQNNPIQV